MTAGLQKRWDFLHGLCWIILEHLYYTFIKRLKFKASRAEDLLEEIQQLKVIKEKICLLASFVADGHSINKKFARLYHCISGK